MPSGLRKGLPRARSRWLRSTRPTLVPCRPRCTLPPPLHLAAPCAAPPSVKRWRAHPTEFPPPCDIPHPLAVSPGRTRRLAEPQLMLPAGPPEPFGAGAPAGRGTRPRGLSLLERRRRRPKPAPLRFPAAARAAARHQVCLKAETSDSLRCRAGACCFRKSIARFMSSMSSPAMSAAKPWRAAGSPHPGRSREPARRRATTPPAPYPPRPGADRAER